MATGVVEMMLLQNIVPVMEKNRFAELIGMDIGIVNGWIEKGHLETVKFGRYRLINLLALSQVCMNGGSE